MTENPKSHSVADLLSEHILAMATDHSWTWREDENGVTATSIHDPECCRCKGEAALTELLEQIATFENERKGWIELAEQETTERKRIEEQLEASQDRVYILEQQLRLADDMCARSFGACFDRSVISNPASKPEEDA